MDSNQSNSGLLRFLSAPSSVLDYGGLVNKTDYGGLVNKTSSESERLFSRFCDQSESPAPENNFRELDDKSAAAINSNPNQHHKYGSGFLPPHYPRQNLNSTENGSFMAMEAQNHQNQVKSVGSSLSRQSSSPAGLFSHISIPNNGYSSTMKGDGNFGAVSPSSNRLKTQISFSSSRLPSSLGMLSQISEAGHQSLGASVLEEEKLGNGNNDARYYGSGYPYSSWNESSNFAENFGGLRRDQDSNRKLGSSIQNEELGNRIHLLSHHLSLPKNSVEVEKFLHFQDSVPCKVRAKRGCATHPRSIAERVRRTRISERMRKLQELVPNMDKQTNTADMLDLAVDYIKELQRQFKTLSDKRANCKCITTQKPISNQVG